MKRLSKRREKRNSNIRKKGCEMKSRDFRFDLHTFAADEDCILDSRLCFYDKRIP
jgi:hypothetical protein